MKNKIKRFLLKLLNTMLIYKQELEFVDLKKRFKDVGENFKLRKDYSIYNPQYMEIGSNFRALERFRIEAFDAYGDQKFYPKIKIGNNVCFNTDIHIGCIDSITIEDNCLFASRILITDHNHGNSTNQTIKISPMNRKLFSKGPVLIKKNVWVGEGVAIMPNVTIGENSIIAANAVVTKNVPPNCIVAGVPAQIIKKFQ